MPSVFLSVVFIGREHLRSQLDLFALFVLVSSYCRLLLSSSLALILQVEANGLLEIYLNSTALVWPLQGIVDLTVDLGSVESTISMVEGPGESAIIQGYLEG